ncbi:MAG: ATP-binding protein, partial [Planktothrix sp.]
LLLLIGLSLCKRIIAAHYGNIWVDSSFTKGSCFHFTLPVYH